jgi:microcystin-dependent protein
LPDTTPKLDLPFPETTDDADVPADIEALALRVEELLLGGDSGLAGWTTGDFKVSALTASHGRWLLCDGTEKTAAEIVTALGLDSGDADDLATLLGTGGSSIYGAAASGKVKLPDGRGRAIVIAGAGSGLTNRVRGAAFGAETHLLSGPESGERGHSHSAHSADHDHGGSTSMAGDHDHLIRGESANNTQTGGSSDRVKDLIDADGFLSPSVDYDSGRTSDDGDHLHSIEPDAGAITVVPESTTSADQPHNNVQPSLALGHLFIRV